MPTINTRGQVIQELSPSDPEDREFIRILEKVRVLDYPRDVEMIRHLNYSWFCHWLYGLDPKVALYLTNEKKFSLIQRDMRTKTWLHDLYDRAWRILHGLDF